MGNLSVRAAVKIFDVSKPTLLKDLSSGKVSGVKGDAGQWDLDPSELARVYRARPALTAPVKAEKLPIVDRQLPPPVNVEVEALKAQLAEAEKAVAIEREKAAAADKLREAAERLAEERAARIEDLRRMLPPPVAAAAPQPAPERKGLFARLFG